MKNFLRLTSFSFILSLYKQFICKRRYTVHKENVQKCSAYLRVALKTIATPLSTVFTRIIAASLIKFPPNAVLI